MSGKTSRHCINAGGNTEVRKVFIDKELSKVNMSSDTVKSIRSGFPCFL